MKKYIILLLPIIFIVASCKKEKLEGDLEVFRGKFKWVGNYGRSCTFCPVQFYDNSNADFSADIEFDNSGKVTFFIDEEIYVQKRFRIKSQEPNGLGGWEIDIKVDVPKSKLDINDKLSLSLIGDTLNINSYPLPGYPGSGSSMGNVFVRQ